MNSWFIWLWAHTTWAAAPASPDAIYLVMVDRFANGDTRNDADADPTDPIAFHGGDLAGIVKRIDHIQDLGIRTLWLTPITQMRDTPIGGHSPAHGYWVDNGRALEPRFGTQTDLDRLRATLDDRGMRLVLDMVTNHVAPQSPLTQDHPEWFHTNGDITDWGDPIERMYNDVHGLPDLAQEQPEVKAHLIAEGLHWIEKARPDGFRLDAVSHVPADFVSVYARQMRAAGGEHFQILGEIFDGNPVHVAEIARTTGLTQTFDFPLHYALIDAICSGGDLRKLATVLSADADYPAGHSHLTFVDNHDTPRIASACGDDAGKVVDVLRLLFALRGTPVITYGTEAGMNGTSEHEARASMDFAKRTTAFDAIQQGMALRAAHPALDLGDTRILSVGPDHISVLRTAGEDRVLVQIGSDQQGLRSHASALYEQPGRVWIGAVNSEDQAAGLQPPEESSVQLDVSLDVASGPPIWITGSRRALGGWEPTNAIGPLKPGEVHHIEVERGSMLALKAIRIQQDGAVQWLSDTDQFVWVPENTLVPVEVIIPSGRP